MAHDIRVETKRWQIRKVVNLGNLYLRVNTIINAAQRYETAVFQTDDTGRMRDLGFKYYKKHESMQEAIDFNKYFCETLKLQDVSGLEEIDIYKKLDEVFADFIYLDGPRTWMMPPKNPPNVAIGQKPEDM
jgi:hypothetical protein